jgi:hypothetical protein
MFVHTVYFWLDSQMPADVKQNMLNDCETLLSRIPGVCHAWGGKPAMTPRDIVDNSYDIGLCVVLHDAKGHDEYQVHPLHQQFAGAYKKYWKRVQVYDFHRGS